MKTFLNRILPLSKNASENQINILHQKLNEMQNKLEQIETLLYCQMNEETYPKVLKQWYRANTGNILNLENPQTYNEKIQWLKLYDRDTRKTELSDKYLVRNWIKDKIGEQYLIPLLGVYENAREIDFNTLPNSFVIKANHGSGWNCIVKNKGEENFEEIRARIDRWMRTDFAFENGYEMQYHNIQRKIIAEEYLKDENDDLPDFKFWCFNGKCRLIEYVRNRFIGGEIAIFDPEWNRMPFSIYPYKDIEERIEMPVEIPQMISISEKLAEGFVHVRIDLYLLDHCVKFGEMTFTNRSGTCRWKNPEADYEIGKMLILPE